MDDTGLVYEDWAGDKLEYRIITVDDEIVCHLTMLPGDISGDVSGWQTELGTPALLALAVRLRRCVRGQGTESVVSAEPGPLVLHYVEDGDRTGSVVSLRLTNTWAAHISKDDVEAVATLFNRIRTEIHSRRKATQSAPPRDLITDMIQDNLTDIVGRLNSLRRTEPAEETAAEQAPPSAPLLDRTEDLIKELATLSATLRETNAVLSSQGRAPAQTERHEPLRVWEGSHDLVGRLRQLGVSPQDAGKESPQILLQHRRFLAARLTGMPGSESMTAAQVLVWMTADHG